MKCFVIMPFAGAFDRVFQAVSEAAVEAVGGIDFDCFWLKDVHAAGRITDDIIRGLDQSAFCIADVSGDNPNVMWETGYAMALRKPTILIGQDLASLPFDLQAHRVLEYSLDALPDLKARLAKAVRHTLARYEIKTTGSTEPLPPGTEHKTISVTGSMRASEAAATRRIEDLLAPYLSDRTTWLVGTVGTVDLVAVQFLLEHEQRVTAVGYNPFDCAEELRALIEEGKLRFLDASAESLPKGLEGPTSRDVLFCTKSDLVVLLWDGQSRGTQEMVRFYQEQGVNTLLAFV
jgi:hypothetical protein